ncbi:hypothetical protein ASPWEDRAFT_22816 [Aspergillus wentii DTO 134E9]|uniref:Major facilitator superfamily (MFS) profile domain-containing protein n=1 Tax=Aspergillus wentii DTO 134E9 TaxID=1073089 RepID=A0A1L9S0G8_ASPWE|nr:uncharacterized protein ASPWEDRAFT_22816 [Aspergillus wentii DTO 134E9]OJJ40654.1 hypothetical protein ASPWEDRAFT_22816 [Aspergillus wentii DTO 134E9]
MCFAMFTDTFIYGMIVPILPYLLLQGGEMSDDDVQKWTSILLATYGAAILIGSPLIGMVSDRIQSRRSPLLIGFVTIALSTSFFLFARSPVVLVLARFFQGLSGAIIGVLGLAMIADTAPPDKVGGYMAVGSLSFAWGMLSGPAIGGALFDKLGIFGAFGVPIMMLVIDIILRILIIEKKDGKEQPQSQPDEEAPLLRHESSQESLSLKNFFHPRLMTAVIMEVIVSSILTGFETTLPLFTRETYGWSSTGAGLVFLPLTIPSFLSIPLSKHARRYGCRKVVAIELILSFFPIVALRFTEPDSPHNQILFMALLTLIGFFMTTAQAFVMTEVSDAIREIEVLLGVQSGKSSGMGTGYAFCNMAMATGQFIGPVLAGSTKLGLGWGMMAFILGGINCAVGLLSLVLV